ncbi:hypothetical protein MIR68_010225 [Amoeboaphelidium protococcarum]|nr:hypothetical protein MIR68_010225 [Amoeboaphelidium protococcarum]
MGLRNIFSTLNRVPVLCLLSPVQTCPLLFACQGVSSRKSLFSGWRWLMELVLVLQCRFVPQRQQRLCLSFCWTAASRAGNLSDCLAKGCWTSLFISDYLMVVYGPCWSFGCWLGGPVMAVKKKLASLLADGRVGR